MTWEPTTRGTSASKSLCDCILCDEDNINILHCVVDSNGIKLLCPTHFKRVNLLFLLIKNCHACARNHGAELYKNERTIHSVKFADKWWDLCIKHMETYDDMFPLLFMD